MNIPERINALRALMEKNHFDAYLVPTDDNHQSEYANYPSDADYETKSKLQEIGYKEFYIYHEPTDTYIPY